MQTIEQTVCVLYHVLIIRLHPVCVKAWVGTGKLGAYIYLIECVGTVIWAYFEFTVLCIHWLSCTPWKVSKYGVFSDPQGYDQKCKLFRTNSFVLAHSSAKKIYIEQLTVKSSIQWYHMTLIWRHLVLAVVTG